MSSPSKNLKVAVMISGQLRTFRDVWPRNLEKLSLPGVDVEVYIDTWAEYGSTEKTLRGYRGNILGKSFDPFTYSWESKGSFDLDEVQSVIPNADAYIWGNNFEEILSGHTQLRALKRELDPVHHRAFVGTAAMYYLLEKSFERALMGPVTYDYFLRIRPDWVLRRNILPELIEREKDLVFFDSKVEDKAFGWGYVTDVCFGGNLESMRLASGSFSSWVSKVAREGWKRYSQAHPAHDHLLLAESVLSFQLRNFRKLKRVVVAEANAGYILREGRDVQSRRNVGVAGLLENTLDLFKRRGPGGRSS